MRGRGVYAPVVRPPLQKEESWEDWTVRQHTSRRSASKLWTALPSGSLLGAVCTTALVYDLLRNFSPYVPLVPFASSSTWVLSLLAIFPLVSHAVFCILLTSLGALKSLQESRVLMACVAIAFSAAEVSPILLRWNDTTICILFHKYFCVRLMLDLSNKILSRKTRGGALRDACLAWALSFRFIREVVVDLALLAILAVLTWIPGLGTLHACFLFRIMPKSENRERLLRGSVGPDYDPLDLFKRPKNVHQN